MRWRWEAWWGRPSRGNPAFEGVSLAQHMEDLEAVDMRARIERGEQLTTVDAEAAAAAEREMREAIARGDDPFAGYVADGGDEP